MAPALTDCSGISCYLPWDLLAARLDMDNRPDKHPVASLPRGGWRSTEFPSELPATSSHANGDCLSVCVCVRESLCVCVRVCWLVGEITVDELALLGQCSVCVCVCVCV